MTIKKNLKTDGLSSDINLATGNIYSYSSIDLGQNIAIINIETQNPVIVQLSSSIFSDVVTGKVTISGVTTTTEINGEWYYTVINPYTFSLYYDKTFNSTVNGSLWTPYIPLETVTNTNGANDNVVIVDGNVDIGVNHIQPGWIANDGSANYTVTSVAANTPSTNFYTITLNGGNFALNSFNFTGPAGGGFATVTAIPSTNFKISTLSNSFEFTNTGNLIFPDNTVQTTAYQLPKLNYRGFEIGCNQFWVDGPSVNQIIITNNTSPVYYTNVNDIKNADNFLAVNLNQSTINVILNLYGNYYDKSIALSYMTTFAKAYIDTILYGDSDILVSIATAKTNFYAHIDSLIELLPKDTLINNFGFSDINTTLPTYNNPSYSSTSLNGTGFNFNVLLQPNIYVLEILNYGNEYLIGDVITVDGSQLGGVSGVNDCVITVTNVDIDNNNNIVAYDITGLPNFPWPSDHIYNGGSGQYNNGNYIRTNLSTNIPYGSGAVVTGSASDSCFGTGSSYVTLYQNSVFSLITVDTNDIYYFGTLGSMGNSCKNKVVSLLVGGLYPIVNGQMYGDINGIGAIYAGIPVDFSTVYNPVIQASGNTNAYTQINFQNINNQNQNSADYVVTTSDGTDTQGYIDLGITGSAWDGTQENSIGTAGAGRDGYLYVQGGLGGGNLIIGTTSASTEIKFLVGGPNTGNIIATINSTGISTTGAVSGSRVITTPVAYSTLTAVAGARAFINDGNLVAAGGGSFGAQVSGDGANICPVWSDGTNWYIG